MQSIFLLDSVIPIGTGGQSLQTCSESVYLDQKIVHEVIRIRKSAKIKLPDAIIAASAIVNHSELITRNTKDFEIPGRQLKLFNPFDN